MVEPSIGLPQAAILPTAALICSSVNFMLPWEFLTNCSAEYHVCQPDKGLVKQIVRQPDIHNTESVVETC